jgi:hypothetical protein
VSRWERGLAEEADETGRDLETRLSKEGDAGRGLTNIPGTMLT